MDPNVRLILAWTGQALMYSTPVVVMVLCVWFFGQLGRWGALRGREMLPAFQGMVSLASAMFCLGMGLALLSLSSAPLVPLAFGMIGLGLFIAAYGVKLIRTRS